MARYLLCFILIVFCLPAILSSPLISGQEEIADYEKRLQEIAGEIEILKTRIKRDERKKASILTQLDRISTNKRLIKKEISLYNIQMRKANKELSALNRKIPELRATLEEEKESIGKILTILYKYGRIDFIDFIIEADDMGSLLQGNKHLVLLAQHQDKIVADYLQILNELNAAEKKLAEKKQEISGLIQAAQQKKQDLEGEEKKNRDLVREIDQNKKIHLKTMGELEDRAEQLQKLMKKILNSKIPPTITLIPLYEKKAALSWPLTGRVVTRFGLQRHPRFNTTTMNNGIEIAPRKDMVVRCVHPGTVAYSDHFQGYGNLIIIDHGMSYYTLYGHCSDFLVKKGDPVQADQSIALVGDYSSLKGTTLYFEIRFKTKPLNPLQWLKRR
ncbi:MAG: peptidoglycan DD-metalloendopeptidase family protein [Candidatus Aminicenantes bacterium]|jgi:septal ring factor EnvC (AmiA/AmiB activator)